MPKVGPIKRRDLIRNLRALGFDGPYPAGNHERMMRENVSIPIPNPHEGDISQPLLQRILKQAGISRNDWEAL
jgi:predicted RNA binding protein YcfA (HicA-like mRNA interferase family)